MNNIKTQRLLLTTLLVSVTLAHQFSVIQAQSSAIDNNIRNENVATEREPIFRKMLNNMMSVNVPVFYDMVKDGSNMGINVLSGLVKVERGDVATRSGLQGARPLSVRVFGVPVYERGQRVRYPPDVMPPRTDDGSRPDNIPNNNESDELPIEP